MEELLSLLNGINPLSEQIIAHLRSVLKHKKLEKKEFLLKAGKISGEICFISSGLLRCYFNRHSREISTWFMREGDVVISVESFFKQVQSKEFIQALEPTELWYIDYQELVYIYKNFIEFNFHGRQLTERYYVLSEQRVNSMRDQRAHERYRFLIDNNPDIIRRVPSKFIASYLGITEVTLSTIKSKKLVY
jgi:CRP/FNR family transcriptional regulator, anaerobic regulatory protein